MRQFLILPLIACALDAVPAWAHHGDAGRYEDSVVVVAGTVVDLQLVDPHSIIVFDVMEGGKSVRFQAELNGRAALSRMGWTRNTLKPGDKIKVTGRRVKSGAPYMNLTDRANVVLVDSGKEIFKTDNYGTEVRKNPVVVN
jgi:hypothetical protein